MRPERPENRRVPRAFAAIAFLVAIPATLALNACNTTEGAGEDIKALGEAIDEAAEDAKN